MRFSRQAIHARYGKAHRIGQIYLLAEQRIAYVAVPKAGCSSLKLLMERIHRNDPDYVVRNIHKNRSLPPLRQLGWDRVAALQDAGLYGFTFVRDPVRRALSCWRDKMRARRYREEINTVLGRADLRQPVTFDAFLDALDMMDPATMDAHWRPQHLVTMWDEITYDRVGRLENITADMALIRAESGLPDLPLPHRNPSPAPPDDLPTRTQRARLERIYARDFALFGY